MAAQTFTHSLSNGQDRKCLIDEWVCRDCKYLHFHNLLSSVLRDGLDELDPLQRAFYSSWWWWWPMMMMTHNSHCRVWPRPRWWVIRRIRSGSSWRRRRRGIPAPPSTSTTPSPSSSSPCATPPSSGRPTRASPSSSRSSSWATGSRTWWRSLRCPSCTR